MQSFGLPGTIVQRLGALISGVLVASAHAAAAWADGQTIIVSQGGQNGQAVTCGPGDTVRFTPQSGGGVVTIHGPCAQLRVESNSNTISIDQVQAITVVGDMNSVNWGDYAISLVNTGKGNSFNGRRY